MKLSVLDYAVVDEGKTDIEAINESVELVKLAEELGYERFWIAEHHDVAALGSTTPELLMLHFLNNTKKIEIGSGGIMLPHYSPYKIAEWIKMLSALYPKRVNLGIGNNPGTQRVRKMMETSILQREDYNNKSRQLAKYLYEDEVAIHPYEAKVERMWFLSSGENSAHLAAELGQNYAYGLFLNASPDSLHLAKRSINLYRSEMLKNNKEPKVLAAVFVVIGEDEEEARSLVNTLDVWLLGKKEFGDFTKFPSITTAQNYELNDYEREKIEKNRPRLVWGTKEQVIKQLRTLEKELDLEELMCVPLVPTIEKRKNILTVLAKEFLN